MAPKQALTPRQKLEVAYQNEVLGITQQDLAVIHKVNIGRINEAIGPIRQAAGLPARRSED